MFFLIGYFVWGFSFEFVCYCVWESGVEFHGIMCGEACVDLHDVSGETGRGLKCIVCRNTVGEFQSILFGETGLEM